MVESEYPIKILGLFKTKFLKFSSSNKSGIVLYVSNPPIAQIIAFTLTLLKTSFKSSTFNIGFSFKTFIPLSAFLAIITLSWKSKLSLFIAKSNWWLANSSPIVPADKLTIAMPFFFA